MPTSLISSRCAPPFAIDGGSKAEPLAPVWSGCLTCRGSTIPGSMIVRSGPFPVQAIGMSCDNQPVPDENAESRKVPGVSKGGVGVRDAPVGVPFAVSLPNARSEMLRTTGEGAWICSRGIEGKVVDEAEFCLGVITGSVLDRVTDGLGDCRGSILLSISDVRRSCPWKKAA